MKDELKNAAEVAQSCMGAPPVIVVGSGLSADSGVRGMGDLADYLSKHVSPMGQDVASWNSLSEEIRARGLESALQAHAISPSLLREVVRHTHAMVSHDDMNVLKKVLMNEIRLPLAELLAHIFQSVHTTINVVTTNYDRLIEYASDSAGYHHDTGFTFGHIRRRRPSRDGQQESQRLGSRTVTIAKVHGSIDWFTSQDGETIGASVGTDYPSYLMPAIVTPGRGKFEQSYQEPFRNGVASADVFLSRGAGYICLGYGFNDAHIQPKLVERVKTKGVPIVILSRTLTPATREFMQKSCRSGFLAIERRGAGSRMYTQQQPEGADVPVADLWRLQTFIEALVI